MTTASLITKTEVAQTPKSLKPGRAPGPDGIINEHYTLGQTFQPNTLLGSSPKTVE